MELGCGIDDAGARRKLDGLLVAGSFDHERAALVALRIVEEQGKGNVAAHPGPARAHERVIDMRAVIHALRVAVEQNRRAGVFPCRPRESGDPFRRPRLRALLRSGSTPDVRTLHPCLHPSLARWVPPFAGTTGSGPAWPLSPHQRPQLAIGDG